MFPSALRSAQVALALSAVSVLAIPSAPRATTCNGSSDLCNRSYGNVTFVGAHDSYAVGVNNAAVNQDYDITQQLNDGIRMLQVQAHNKDGTIELCHSSCSLLDGGSLQDYLGTLKSWMDSNTNDVVTLLIVNIDDLAVSQFDTVFKAAGVDTLSYAPSSATTTFSNWPTLGAMIDNGTRLVTFMDEKADFTTTPYIIDEFTNVWETAYDVTDTTFNCDVNRTRGDTSTQMYLINHFLDEAGIFGILTPAVDKANTTNAVSGVGSLGQQVSTCSAANGRNPNFMLVDFYEYGGGSVFQVAATANGVSYNPSTPIATPKTSSSSSSSSSSNSSAAKPMLTRGTSTGAVAGLAIVMGMVLGASSVF
ncbi:PLC-like phosphodiesterase [Amylostereum chailletii]|nr:PLC-like phosphodiesterase [Amylostereum chailletii]